MPNFNDKTIDRQKKKVKNKKLKFSERQKKLISLRKYDEIRQLNKLKIRLKAIKIRIQEQIEELKNLEYRCRRKRLYFFDTLWRNTANILQILEHDIDSQLFKVKKLLNNFLKLFIEIENLNQKKSTIQNLDYDSSELSTKSENSTNDNAIYSSTKGYNITQPLSKHIIDKRLKRPRDLLDQLKINLNKLIYKNNSRLDEIKIIIEDFKKEYKNKI